MFPREMSKKDSFGKFLLNILKKTEFQGARMFNGSSKCLDQLNSFETSLELQPFVTWFTESITDENCVTNEELEMYNHLKINGELVAEGDLDALISSFCVGSPSELFIYDHEPLLESAKEELQSIESLENFMKKPERTEDKRLSSNFDIDSIISNEISALDKVNKEFNESLEQFGLAWFDLRKNFPQTHLYSERLTDDVCNRINDLNSLIAKNLNEYLNNYFKEVMATHGIIEITVEEYFLVFRSLSNIREEIINVISKNEGILLLTDYLNTLDCQYNDDLSASEIRHRLQEPEIQNKIRNCVIDLTKIEVNSLKTIQIQDARKCATFLFDRLELLKKIEYILRQKKLLNHALYYIPKRKKVVHDFKLEKLNEFYCMIDSYINNFERRMSFMENYEPKSPESLDQNYKNMIHDLNVTDSSLAALDKEIAALHKNLTDAYENLNKLFESLELQLLNRLKYSKEKNKSAFDGPTREAFSQLVVNFLERMRSTQTIVDSFLTKKNKISNMFNDSSINGQSKNDCLWMKFLNDPDNFVANLEVMEAKLNYLIKKNENAKLKSTDYL